MANTAEYLIKIGADSKSVTKAIQSTNREVRSLESQGRDLDKAFTLTGNTGLLDKRLAGLRKQLELTESNGRALKSQLASLSASKGFDENSVKAQRLREQIGKTETQTELLKAKIATVGNGKGIEETSRQFTGLSKAVGVGTVALGSFIANGITAAVSAIGSLVPQMVEASDAVNKFQKTMAFAGKSSSEIKRVSDAGQDYANKTVYDLNTILNTTAQLASNAVPNYDKLVQAAGNLNAVAGGSADTFRSVAMVLTQTAGEGKLTTENWNQLSDAVAGASGPLQKQLLKNGAYTGNFRKAMSDGKISANEFNKAIMQLGFTKTAENAATATDTIEGAWGNLEAGVVTAGQNIIDRFKPIITGSINAVTSGVGNVTNGINAALSSIKMPDATQLFSGFSASIGGIVASVSQALRGLDTSGLTNLAAQVLPALKAGFSSFLSYVTPAIAPLVQAFGNLWNSLQPVLTAVAGALVPAFRVLGSYFGGVLSGALQTITLAFNGMAAIARLLTPAVIVIINTFKQFAAPIATLVGKIGQFVGANRVMMGVLKLVANVGASAFSLLRSVGSSTFSFLRSGFSVVGRVFSSVGSGIRGVANFIASAFRGASSSMSGAFSFMRSGFSSVGRLFSYVGSAIRGVASSIVRAFSGIGSRIASYFSGVTSKIASKFSGVYGRIRSAFGNVRSIGVNVVRGIAAGITGGISYLYNTVTRMAGQVTAKIRSIFKIHSPSQLMRDEVGVYLTAGIADGMTSNMESLTNAAQTVKATTLQAFQNFSPTGFTDNDLNGGSDGGGSFVFNITGSKADAGAIEIAIKKVLRQANLIS